MYRQKMLYLSCVPAGNVVKLSFCKDLTPTPLQGRGNWNGATFELKTLNLMTLPSGVFTAYS